MDNATIVRIIKLDILTNTPNKFIDWLHKFFEDIEHLNINGGYSAGGETIYYTDDGRPQWVFYMHSSSTISIGNAVHLWERVSDELFHSYYDYPRCEYDEYLFGEYTTDDFEEVVPIVLEIVLGEVLGIEVKTTECSRFISHDPIQLKLINTIDQLMYF